MPALQVSDLSKSFAGQVALAGLDITVAAGQVHALLGGNGSGKSTFIKVLSGYHKPDPGGSVLLGGKKLSFGSPESSRVLGCRFVHQDLGLVETSSILDNLMLGRGFPRMMGTINGKRARALASEMLARADLDLDPGTLVGALSPAQRTEVAVARALSPIPGEDARLLVLDEPTANLPHDEVDQLLATIRRVSDHGIGVLFVTHRLEEVLRVAHRVTVLRDGRRVEARNVDGLSRSDLVHMLVGDELEEAHSRSERMTVKADSPTVISVRSVSTTAIAPFDVDIKEGEIVGVAGITGSGREAFLGAIFGAIDRTQGTVEVNGLPVANSSPRSAIRAGMSFMPAERRTRGGVMSLTAAENMSLASVGKIWRFPIIRRAVERAQTQSWFDRLGVRPASGINMPLAAFSGGNQQKVLLARWLNCTPRALLVDEPTQGVDVGARAKIHEQLVSVAARGAAVVVSSSDVDELVALSHRIVILQAGRVAATLSGDELTVANVTRHTLASTH